MKIIFILLLLLPSLARADFVASAGLIGGSIETKEESTAGKSLLNVPTYIGFKGEAEFGHPYFTLFGAFDLGMGGGKTEYNFVNEDNPADQAQVSGLDSNIFLSRFTLGGRARLIKLKTFRLYVGGGIEYGLLNIIYNEDDFISTTGTTTGFEESESQAFRGGFAHAGMEFIVDQNTGFRVQVQKDYFRTDKYETLNQEELRFDPTTFSVMFMQYIDT